MSPISAACSRVCCYDIVFLFHESRWLPDVPELPAVYPGRSVFLCFFVKAPFPAVKFLTQRVNGVGMYIHVAVMERSMEGL